MRLLLLLGFVAVLAFGQEYVPGTPGAPWTKEEVLVVKAKLYSMFKGQKILGELETGGKNRKKRWMKAYFFSERKVLRLGFHDCLKYKDGSGGCDGCLNWHGVNEVQLPWGKNKTDVNDPNTWYYPDAFETNNRGLGNTVSYLEKIYTDPNYPNLEGVTAPALNESLKASGKSRADLWAFAVITALEYAIENNDIACDMSDLGKVCKDANCDNFYYENCNYRAGTPECKIQLPRPVQFQTGRKDCTEFGDIGYKATKEEAHPDAQGNGKSTVDFFVKNFNFTGREMVAIMGTHTVGKFNWHNSYLSYVWTCRGITAFNNHYYKNIARIPMPNIQDPYCTIETDAEGRAGPAYYLTIAQTKMKGGGPIMWINHKYGCGCNAKTADDWCCANAPEGMQCVPDADTFEEDENHKGGCERFRANLGQDDINMNHEMGLYFDFEVKDGMPVGCPGFAGYESDDWKEYMNQPKRGGFWPQISRLPLKPNPVLLNYEDWTGGADPGCEKNKMEVPPGSTPLHEIFEEYGHDQQAWVNDYVPTFEKMLANGYQDGELTNGPDQFTGIVCPRDADTMICYDTNNPPAK